MKKIKFQWMTRYILGRRRRRREWGIYTKRMPICMRDLAWKIDNAWHLLRVKKPPGHGSYIYIYMYIFLFFTLFSCSHSLAYISFCSSYFFILPLFVFPRSFYQNKITLLIVHAFRNCRTILFMFFFFQYKLICIILELKKTYLHLWKW